MNDILVNSIMNLMKDQCARIFYMNLTTEEYRVIWNKDGYFNPDEVLSTSDSLNMDLISKTVHPDDIEKVKFYADIDNVISDFRTNVSIKMRYRHLYKNGNYGWMEVEVCRACDFNLTNISFIVLVKDIDKEYAEDYKRHREMETLSTKDPLTGFNNRYAYDQICSNSEYTSVGVAYIDLNRLKQINDTRGHEAGDAYILYVCKLLTSVFREADCYRIGGDEFVVLIPSIPKDTFTKKVKSLLDINEANADGIPYASIGYDWSESSDCLKDAISKAETLMYKTKELYRRKYHITREVSEENN